MKQTIQIINTYAQEFDYLIGPLQNYQVKQHLALKQVRQILINKLQDMQKCAVCQKPTDKCCSLCRKVFYCSAQHQQFHWHTSHKFQCQGKVQSVRHVSSNAHNSNLAPQSQQFRMYNTSQIRSRMTQIKEDHSIKDILQLLQDRFVLRKTLLTSYSRINKNSTKQQLNDIVQQGRKLVLISQQISHLYKPSISVPLKEQHGINMNQYLVATDLMLDRVLLVRLYYAAQMRQQMTQLVLIICKQLRTYDEQMISKENYRNSLVAALQAFECVRLDRGTQVVMGKYIRFIQQTEGLWQQIYSYYNLGNWYSERTYYDKAVRAFEYVLQLLTVHKSTNQDSVLFRADTSFNLALAKYAGQGNIQKAAETMLQAYHLRVRGLGKNSIEAGDCLEYLARWMMVIKDWENCLFYLEQCYRIKKQYEEDLESTERVRKLVQNVYSQIYEEKSKNQQAINPKTVKYYDHLLQKHPNKMVEMPNLKSQKNQNFAAEILKDDRQFIKFKVNLTPQLSDTFDSTQWQKMIDLMSFMDQKVEKGEAVKMLVESAFFNSLNEKQKDQFLQMNNIH